MEIKRRRKNQRSKATFSKFDRAYRERRQTLFSKLAASISFITARLIMPDLPSIL